MSSDLSSRPRDRLWKPFRVPPQLVGGSATFTNRTASPLLRLSGELIGHIIDRAGLVEQLALASTCKHLMHLAHLFRLKSDALAGEKVKRHRKQMKRLLRLLRPLTVIGSVHRGWGMCVDCLRYRPTRTSYWMEMEMEMEMDRGRVVLPDLWEWRVKQWADTHAAPCPACWFPGACRARPTRMRDRLKRGRKVVDGV
ncbi:MAG: hypothetical protein M1826_005003 [Phylliscum demangeonii]|nr:MAG: hypothetical protein M1826_005003 [Phylliscum demangeonii]